MKRSIVYIYSTHCPRCGYVERTIIDKVRDAFPDSVAEINGDTDRAAVKRYGVKGAPTIIYMENGTEKGRTVNAHWSADRIRQWLAGGEK